MPTASAYGNPSGDAWLSLARSRFTYNAGPGVNPRERLRELDSEFEAIERASVNARRLRNLHLAACRAPPEVLNLIFRAVQAIWKPNRTLGGPSVYHSGWMTIVHVCGVWREVALNTPVLWARHPNCVDLPPLYVPDITFRSGIAPLDINFDWECVLEDEMDPILSTWFSPLIVRRIRCLTLTLFDPEEFNSACNLLPPNLPNLRELHIWATLSCDRNVHRELPDTLRNIPVTKLTLVDCSVAWDSPIFSNNLTHLRLTLIPAPGIYSYQIAQDLFSRLSCLEELEIEIDVPLADDVTHLSPETPEITFANSLRRLTATVASGIIGALVFIQASRIPEACDRHVTFYGPGSLSGDALSTALKYLLPQSVLIGPAEKQRLLLLGTRTLTFGSTSLTSHGRDPWHAAAGNAFLSTSETHNSLYISTANFCEHLPYLPLGAVPSLALVSSAIQHFQKTKSWSRLLIAANVRELSVPKAGCLETLHALAGLHELSSDNKSCVLLPSLGVLRLYIAAVEDDDDKVDESAYAAEILALISLVAMRREHGTPLREVVVPRALSGWNVWNTIRPSVDVNFDL